MEIGKEVGLIEERTEKIVDWLRKLNRWFIAIGLVSLFAMMVVDTVNIIGIKLGVRVIPAGKTIIEELMTVAVFIGLGFVLLERGHIRTDIVKTRLSARMRFTSDVVSSVVIILVSGFISWTNGKTAIEYFAHGVTSPADIAIPMAPFFLLITLSFLNIGLCSAALLIRDCVKKLCGSEE